MQLRNLTYYSNSFANVHPVTVVSVTAHIPWQDEWSRGMVMHARVLICSERSEWLEQEGCHSSWWGCGGSGKMLDASVKNVITVCVCV